MEDKRKQIFNRWELEESENINTNKQTNKQTLKQQSRWFLRLKRNGESTW